VLNLVLRKVTGRLQRVNGYRRIFCLVGLYSPIRAFISSAKQFIHLKVEMEILVYPVLPNFAKSTAFLRLPDFAHLSFR